MAKVTDEDIRDRFEIGTNGDLRWRRVWPEGGEPFAVRAAQRLNRMAGKAVVIRAREGVQYVVLYGQQLAVSRVMKALAGADARADEPAKVSGLPKGITHHRGQYQVRIYQEGSVRFVGMYASLGDAVAARARAELAKAEGRDVRDA